jgi:chitin synthase
MLTRHKLYLQVLFAFIILAMFYVSGFIIYASIPRTAVQWMDIKNLFLDNAALRDIVLSIASTYGLYFVSSVLYLEPWHM